MHPNNQKQNKKFSLLIKNSFKETNTTQKVDRCYHLDWTELCGGTQTGARSARA